MADYQRVVEEIRFFLQGADQTLRDEIREWASGYAEAAKEANERLRRCKEFLNQNLRSEAIHVAEADPNLMEMVSVLDFPELPEWEEFCADHALTAPPKVLLLVAEDLNQAYAIEEPLKDHLKKLRKLALTRAPLDQRIAVMRSLADLDPDSHFWKEDITVFEAARQHEFEAEAREAANRGDADRLKALVLELQSDKWLRKPSEELINSVKRSYVKLTRSSGRERLEQILPQLIEAAQQGDVDRARRIRADWEQALREARIGPDDPLSQGAAPALDWISQHDQHAAAEAAFQSAVAGLTNELNRGAAATIPELERTRQEALAYGRPLPPDVEERYTSTVNRIRAAAKWQRKLYLTGTLAGLLVVVGLMVFFVVAGMRGSAVRAAVDRMQALIDAADIDGATKLRAELRDQSPELLATPQLAGLLDTLTKLETDDEDRAARFSLHLDTAQKFLDRQAMDKASEELAEAEKIAKRTQERTEIAKIRKSIELARTDRTQGNERLVETTAATADAKLDSVDKALMKHEFAEATSLLGEVRDLLATTRDLTAGVSDAALKRLKEVQTRLDGQQSRLADAREANLLESRIAEAVATLSAHPSLDAVERFESLLRDFGERYPDSSHSAGFGRTRSELDFVKGAVAWNEKLRPWTTVDSIVRLNAVAAENRAKMCQEMLNTYAGAPDSARERNYQTYLASIARQDEVVASLQNLFKSELLQSVWQVRQGESRWYSSDGKISDENVTIDSKLSKGADSIHFNYICSSDGRKRLKKLKTPKDVVTTCVKAPQTVLSDRILESLDKIKVAPDWEAAIVEILRMIESDTETDPLLRVILLSTVLKQAGGASTVLQQAGESHLKAIEASGVDPYAFWMDPDDAHANESRAKAVKLFIDRFPDLSTISPQLTRYRESVAQPLLTRYEIVGVLRSAGAGQWRCDFDPSRQSSLKDMSLAVIAPGSGGRTSLWKTIGSVRQGETVLRAEASDLQEGRLVFGVERAGPAR